MSLRFTLPALIAASLALAVPATSNAVMVSRARACPGAYTVPTPATMYRARAATLCLINYERSMRRMVRLRSDYRLSSAAARHSSDMVARHYFAHDTLGGGTFITRIRAAHYIGYGGTWTVGENIAWGSGSLGTPASTMLSWMRSPEHRANILKVAYREIGVGMVLGRSSNGMPTTTYTTDFGRRG